MTTNKSNENKNISFKRALMDAILSGDAEKMAGLRNQAIDDFAAKKAEVDKLLLSEKENIRAFDESLKMLTEVQPALAGKFGRINTKGRQPGEKEDLTPTQKLAQLLGQEFPEEAEVS